MNKIIPISQPSITQLEIDYVLDVMQSGWISSLGNYINQFEEKFAEYCGTRYALTTSSGTTALHLALMSYGIQAGDEVIVPDLTFIATANAVAYTGAKVVFVDIEEDSLCIDPVKLEQAITEKTKAIIPVHLYGHPANMIAINKLARTYNLLVIEDAAEAHGAGINGQKTGSLGDCGVFSFYGNKIITCGEGGMITTNDEEFYKRAKHLRDHAMSSSKRYWHDELGYNYRMTNMQAALGLAQLERIDELLNRKLEIFERYHKNLFDIFGLKLNFTADWASNVYWLVCIEIEGYTEKERNTLMEALSLKGIETRPYFYPMSDMPMYQSQTIHTPVTHKVYQRGINLPSYFDINNSDIDYICESLRTYLQREGYTKELSCLLIPDL
ncbi:MULTISPECIES: DegT/DnrJ/EryC1/StrS family aminotransferase [unclassified Coleofasciculus]|uniref:DegT/DnrJ/EryC1/StrS family aminotransferase n=1 Tax=unclassified Coleofasciculus TaxID=2692782 RepID=UPI00187FB83E|nr:MULTISPECIES: DegT/DnrJ/EryC1/StrS family aminotransferase [unclassified Coleofasciculus]MBE9125470.1 DegT/DnrJ/EryC1/StrS family aminotransferase [Coleofasciculus sp. LEGE 07081]MBE9147441.1 DegT/DnrJ/EryC1/StrS family aminotransferase [Coleofasciculus sp. LEGE 07092]